MGVTYLEDLPNEIFLYHILPYFSRQETYRTFAHLNQRIDQIIGDSRHFNYTVKEENQNDPVLAYFAPYISRLHVFLGAFDIRPFQSLRSLTLEYPTLHQRNAIRVEIFPLLEDLTLFYFLDDDALLGRIFSNTFSSLKRCHLDRISSNFSWTGSSRIRSLTVRIHGGLEFICILEKCPFLTHLNVFVESIYLSSCKPPDQSMTCVYKNLRSLSIVVHFNLLIELLTMVPNLEKLIFGDRSYETTYGDDKLPRLKPLGNVLRQLHQLKHLECFIAYPAPIEDQSAHPLFVYTKIVDKKIYVASFLEGIPS